MNVWILTKKNVIVILILFIALIAALCISLNAVSAAVSGPARKIPIYSVDCEKKQIALTFNAAWDDSYVSQVLETLNEYEIKASFFFVGDWVEKYPEIVKTIYESGHSIGNHSNAHRDTTKLSAEEIRNDINACNKKIAALTGKSPLFFRAPSGAYDNKTIEAAESLDMMTIQWGIDSKGIKLQ